MNSSGQPGSQPASGGVNGGSVTGGFEVAPIGMGSIGAGAGMSSPISAVGGLSLTDITLEQALSRMQELARENSELREYLKENNEMMKKQFETLSQWKQKVHDANVLNREKFEQTRALITALRSENEELQVSLKESNTKEESLTSKVKGLETELNTLMTAKAASDQLAFNVVKQAEEQGVEVGEDETQMRETVYVASAEKEERIMELEEEVGKVKEELTQMKDRNARLEHDNTQSRNNTEQLLKDLESTQQLKSQIQKENQELRQETVSLRKQMQAMLAESKNSLRTQPVVHTATLQLTGQAREEASMSIVGSGQEGAMGQTPDRTVDDWQESSATVTAEVEQLRKQLDAEKKQIEMLHTDISAKNLKMSRLVNQIELHKNEVESLQSRHEDRIRQLQQEHDSHLEKIEQQRSEDSVAQQHQVFAATHAEDVQTLRSQVLTLINEVHETQNKLGAAQRTIDTKNNRLKELETYSAQMVGESHNRVQQLHQALAMQERQLHCEQQDHKATKHQMNDLHKSFNELVSDYKEVLDTFEQYKADQENQTRSNPQQKQQMDNINHLTAQVLAAEEAINIREDRIKKLQQDVREKEETMDVFRAQAEVFESDFKAERDARTRLAQEKERLAQELEAEKVNSQSLVEQLTRYTQQQLQDMQLRANQGTFPAQHFQRYPMYPAGRQDNYPQSGGHVVGGGGDSGGLGGAGSFNNLAAAEGAQIPRAHNYGTAQHVTAGQHYPTLGQHYPVAQQFAGISPEQRAAGNNVASSAGYHIARSQQAQGGGGGGGMVQPRQHDEAGHTVFTCPSCNQRLPDYDTLTIHVQDCLEQSATDPARP